MNNWQTLLMLSLLMGSTELIGQTPEIKWWFDLNDSAFGSAAAGDIDGDGKYEIAFGCYRNDSTVYALNGEDGSLLWKRNLATFAEGCNDVAPLIYDVDQNGSLEVVVPSSCNPRTFCFEGSSGATLWETELHGSDSPPTVSDVDGDGKPEILHGNFGGSVSCLNAEDGSIAWDFMVDPNSWIQTAPTIFDADNDGELDFFVANSSFGDNHKFYCFRASDQKLLWETDLPDDQMYHGAAVADIDGDGFKELLIGSYDGKIYAVNAEDGSLLWSFAFPLPFYTIPAISIADINNDKQYEILVFDYFQVGALNPAGQLLWTYEIPDLGQSFRGAALADINADDFLDVIFGSTNGRLYALSGEQGSLIWELDLATHYGDNRFELDHGPLIADFDEDGFLDIFIAGGYTTYPDFTENFGRAYLISTNSTGGPEWLMFRRDTLRSGHLPIATTTSTTELIQPRLTFSVFPNPSAGRVQLDVTGIEAEELLVKIFDVKGSLLSQFAASSAGQDKMELSWNEEDQFPAGVYFCEISAGKIKHRQKIVLIE